MPENLNHQNLPPEELYSQPGAYDHNKLRGWWTLHHKLAYVLFGMLFLAIVAAVLYFQMSRSVPVYEAPLHHENTPDPTADWKTYTSTKYGVSFKCPINWCVDHQFDLDQALSKPLLNEQGSVGFFQISAPAKGCTNNCDLDHIDVSASSRNISDLIAKMKTGEQGCPLFGTDCSKFDQSEVEFGGVPATKLDIYYAGKTTIPSWSIFYVSKNNVTFEIWPFTSINPNDDIVISQILSTFKFTDNGLSAEDKDNNGVWDYIQDYIDKKYPTELRPILYAYIRSEQEFILSASNKSDSIRINSERDTATQCFVSIKGYEGFTLLEDVRNHFLNTPERKKAYDQADSNLSGTSFFPPPEDKWSESCKLIK